MVTVFINAETTLLNWQIGNYINLELILENRAEYGAKILTTMSQELTLLYGRGYTYSALTRMCKVARTFHNQIYLYFCIFALALQQVALIIKDIL